MEPIPYFFESIDRNAVLVRPKQPYFDWANKVFDVEVHSMVLDLEDGPVTKE